MLRADWPTLMFSRLRTSRSSTMRPPWMIPMRRIRGRWGPPGLVPAPTLPGCIAMWMVLGSRRLEGSLLHALQDLRQELLLQLGPLVVDAGLLENVEGFRFLDLSLDADLGGDRIDLIT